MPATTLPLRTALIGLSSNAKTAWASTAHLPAFQTAQGAQKLTLTALLNSSTDAAKAAVQRYNLPSTTKTYGSPDELANGPDVDLVICNTRVDKHYETILPSVKKGKDVYVEWPIAANEAQIGEIVDAARQSGARVAVGLQRRWIPVVLKVREVLGQGKLGKILSVDVKGFGGSVDREILPTGLKYFADKKVGGNAIMIGVAHVLDLVLAAVGDVDASTVQRKAQIQRPDVRIRNPESGEIVEKVTSDVPDLLSLHGTLAASEQTAENATLTFSFRRGQPFPGTPAMVWSINCEYGEIHITSQKTTTLEVELVDGEDTTVKIQVHDLESNNVEDVPWTWTKEQREVPLMARSVMKSLYAFADGKPDVDGWVSLEDAARRAALIRTFLK